MKKAILAVLCTVFSATTWAESSIQAVSRPEILGLWGMEVPKNPQCVEYYNFRNDDEVIINSAKEWTIGQYSYQLPEQRDGTLPAMLLKIKYDNNEADCWQQRVDQTGEISQFFVKWDNPNRIEFCAEENGEQCYATLHRQLP